MNNRVKELRKALGVSGEKFGQTIGLSNSAVCLIENGTRGLTDRVIADICRVHNVNEHWLRTGEGEMFVQMSREEKIIDEVSRLMVNSPESIKIKLINVLINVPDEHREELAKFFEDFYN